MVSGQISNRRAAGGARLLILTVKSMHSEEIFRYLAKNSWIQGRLRPV